MQTHASVPEVAGGLPVLGNLLQFRKDRLGMQARAAELGGLARFRLAHLPVYVVTDADLAHRILVEAEGDYKKGRGLSEFLRPLLGDGLLSAEGEIHRHHRKLLAPAFAPKRMTQYGQAMVTETAQALATWHDGDQLDLGQEMMRITLAIAGRTLFGADVRGDSSAVEHALTLGMQSLIEAISSPLQVPYPYLLPRHKKMQTAVRELDAIVFRLMREARAHGEDRGDVMSMLLQARDEDGTGFSDQQIRDEVMTLLLAGHETTANSLAWTCYELGRHPAITAQVRAEVDAVLGGRPATMADCPQLPLTLAVIEETMRLHPPAYALAREALVDVVVDGKRFKAGTTFLVNIRGMHRRADYFEAPEAFRPERMSAEAKKARPRGRYLPFGAGPRVCIGQHFALAEAQLILATLLQTIELTPRWTAPIEPEPLVTLRPKGGVPMQVRRR